ncbi:MAG: LysR family transcriptional regulator, partial [Actinobacteria bacterium]|nr:LysR family transcriptional regulator [Actinomycetota bacterium]
MRIESLREFVEFAKYLSFSTTAKKLYISQPALSNHIALLEKDLGVNLIERSATLRLTSAGKTFLIDAASIVDLADRAVSRCRACSRAAQGKIVIKMPIDLQKTATFFIKKIEAFKENNPTIDVELVTGANRNMFDEIHNGNIDCGLAYGYVSSDDGVCCETIDIGRNRLTLWISKNHPLAGKEPLQLKD